MHRPVTVLAALVSLLIASPAAHADDPEHTPKSLTSEAAHTPTYSFGARAGGYGFRNVAHEELGQWDDCRMDGFGIFAQRSLSRILFAEAGVDVYFAEQEETDGMVTIPEMDRVSGIATLAAGARIPYKWLSPYVQAGVGLELTRARMGEHGLDDSTAVPMGFLGIGADLNVGRVSVGFNARANVMKHFTHGGDGHDHDAVAEAHTEMHGEADIAMQGQLFLKYSL